MMLSSILIPSFTVKITTSKFTLTSSAPISTTIRMIGLKGVEKDRLEEFKRCIREGEPFSIMSVPAKSSNEFVLLLSDKHLDAYISIHVKDEGDHKTVSVISLVKYKNLLGRIYFMIIRPFHPFIVRSVLEQSINKAARRS